MKVQILTIKLTWPLAVQLSGFGFANVALGTRPLPKPGKAEVLVKITMRPIKYVCLKAVGCEAFCFVVLFLDIDKVDIQT